MFSREYMDDLVFCRYEPSINSVTLASPSQYKGSDIYLFHHGKQHKMVKIILHKLFCM